MLKVTEEEKKIIISMYNDGKSCSEIGKSINRHKETVRKYLKTIGIYSSKTNHITEQDLDNIIIDYKNGMRPVDLGKKYNRNPSTIINKLRKLELYSDSRINYTKDDEIFLIDHYKIGDWNSIFKRFPTATKQNVRSKMSKLGVKYDPKNYWTHEELRYLKEHYYTDSLNDIMIALENRHTKDAIQSKAYKYFGFSKDDDWTSEEEDILRSNYSLIPIENICKLIPNRSKNAIMTKAKNLGIKSLFSLQVHWSNAEIEYLSNNWTILSDEEISNNLHKTLSSVMGKRIQLGLKRIGNDPKNYGDLNKYLRGQIWEWKSESMKSCNYECVFTGSKYFQIHHLFCFGNIIKNVFLNNANIIEYKDFAEYSTDELNVITKLFIEEQNKHPLGVCIRKDIHKLYHHLYGKYNNTPEQWEHFKSDLLSGKYKEIIDL